MSIRKQQLGRNLTALMARDAIDANKLAQRIGCSRNSVRSWTHHGVIPSATTAIEIARVFGLTAEELVFGSAKNLQGAPK